MMMSVFPALLSMLLFWTSTSAFNAAAADYLFKGVKIEHPFARATPPGARSGVVFFTLSNTGTVSVRLVGMSSPVATTVELHQMTMENGLMKMRPVSRPEIKPGGELALAPDGYHVMLTDLNRPLVAGERFPLRITFEGLGAVEVSVSVESMAAVAPASAVTK